MKSGAWMRSVLVCAVLSGGCAVGPAQTSFSPTTVCTRAECIQKAAMEPLYERCLTNLLSYTTRPSEQRAIDQEFRYPLRNADSYYSWLRMGGTGPTPHEWCRRYAYRKVGGGGFYGMR